MDSTIGWPRTASDSPTMGTALACTGFGAGGGVATRPIQGQVPSFGAVGVVGAGGLPRWHLGHRQQVVGAATFVGAPCVKQHQPGGSTRVRPQTNTRLCSRRAIVGMVTRTPA